MEHGITVLSRTPDSQSWEPGFKFPLLLFWSLAIFVPCMSPQFTQGDEMYSALTSPTEEEEEERLLWGNSVVTDVQFGHLFLVCIKYDALQEITCGLFRKISHCS